jgi:hypothetical protein
LPTAAGRASARRTLRVEAAARREHATPVTIAACYISPEGVVLGADSTTTYGGGGMEPHYYNNAQKLFEVGEVSTVGVVTWGLGGLVLNSHRRLFAQLADDLAAAAPVASIGAVATRWADMFWPDYSGSKLLTDFATLAAKPPYDPNAAPPAPGARTEDEELQFQSDRYGLAVGFCLAGYVKSDREPAGYQVLFDPLGGKPVPEKLTPGFRFWGAPNMIRRLIYGADEQLGDEIIASGKWMGTGPELDALLQQHQLSHPYTLPIRDAIDFVHSCIYSTIKALKFSNLSQICGGPIELAVITADRPFRWVRHKGWDSAMREGAA